MKPADQNAAHCADLEDGVVVGTGCTLAGDFFDWDHEGAGRED